MKIIDININDFGGINNHREQFKEKYGNYKYLQEWDKLDKSENINGILNYIKRYDPDIVILQEYDINSKEAQFFYQQMTAQGYLLKSETPTKRPSMTVMYIKKSIDFEEIHVGHERNLRAYAIKTEAIIIYGTHIPPKKYDAQFWGELHAFIKKNSSKKYLLIGDFNTINNKNYRELETLLKNADDVWKEKGNNEPLSILGDYVIASKNIEVNNFEIHKFDESYTDHPIILVTLLNN